MITDDERRRVAEKLRESIPGDGVMRRGDKGWSLLYRTIFGHYMHHQSAGRTYSEVASRLADLVEPESERTCRVEASHEVEGDGCYSYFEYELSCGHEIAWGDQLPPSYCPECGRRVLYDSDDYI